ncbi:FGGY-family carbohydrate kinase [Rhodococcoides yunnanense]|uniref:FGGY-family carbohydrate kinase n=1 Tax=Rhodococcoides yunnanense TaxID=278209 RepID=A0ABU4BHN5_9NOCA|nr:FGGY-family carbohydrate kinase [Rhodococcus yunnanensis]MDV6263717.1 FGGY-family carbohydrate kinase [Rhodococcus yunnanensis]
MSDSHSPSVLIGVDKGTSSIKTIAVDAFTGELLAESGCPTPSVRSGSDRHEEECDLTWRTTAGTIADVVAQLPGSTKFLAVGVTGHMGGLWTLDDAGYPVANAVCWPDARASDILDAAAARDTAGRLYALGGNAMIPGMPYPLLAWFKEHEPQQYRRISTVFTAKDYVNYRLTGVIATEESDLSFWPCDLINRTTSSEIFEAFGIPEASTLVPRVLESKDVLGCVNAEAARITGLPVGTPVAAGCGDATANMLGVGAQGDGQATTTLGTSLMNGTSSPEPLFDPPGVGFSFLMPDDRWQRQITNSGGGTLCLDWVVNTFCADLAQQIAGGETTFGAVVESAAARTEPGNRGLIFHPYLNTAGATAPFVNVQARGSFVGFGVETSQDQLIRAVLEGTALAIRDCYESMPTDITEIRLTGGGARSRAWCQVIANVLQKQMVVPDVPESGALGAAMLAGVCVDQYRDLTHAAATLVRDGAVYDPDPDTADTYDRMFRTYRALLVPLAPVWAQQYAFSHSHEEIR